MGKMDFLKKLSVGALTVGRMFDPTGMANQALNALRGAGLVKSPEDEAKMKAILLNHEKEMAQMQVDFMGTVNETMRVEAQSGSKMQRSWRPIVGYTFSAVIINNYILMPYFAPYGLQSVDIPTGVWNAMLMVLGIAAGTRGWEKIEKARNGKEKKD